MEHLRSASYRPQTQGEIERGTQPLKNPPRCIITTCQVSWNKRSKPS